MSFSVDPTAIPGFIAAQASMRQQLGAVAEFGVPTTPQWPEGTPINPDTNLPYDSTVVQANAEYEMVACTVLVVQKEASPLRPQADMTFNESGLREGADIILDVAPADYEATIVNASMFTVQGTDYNIEESKPFSLGGQIYRYIVYGAER